MRNDVKKRLLFSYWPFPPGEAEPAHGYFLRLVKAQGETSLRNFNIWNEIATETAFPTRMLEDIERHPMPEAWLARLRDNTPVRIGNDYLLRGHMLSYMQIGLRPRRWCRGCMHDDAYHRAWWDIPSITQCPFHGVELESRIDGTGVTWRWIDFEHTSDGDAFGEKIEAVQPEPTYERYLLGRLGWMTPLTIRLLDGFAVRDVIQLCEVIGQSLESQVRRVTPPKTKMSAQIGFRALSGDRGDFAEVLRAKLREYTDKPPGDKLPQHFDAISGRLGEFSKGPNALLRRALREAFVAEQEGLERCIVDSDFDVEFLTTREIGKRLGMGPVLVSRVAKELGLFQFSREHASIPASAIPRIAEFRDSLITRFAAFKRLGLRKGTVNHLVRAGFLTVYRSSQAGEWTGGMFSPKEIDGIIEKLDQLPTTEIERRPCTFSGYAIHYNVHQGDLAVACLRGEVPVISRIEGKRGFMRLILEGRPEGGPPKSRFDLFTSNVEPCVNLLEAQVLLNLTPSATRRLKNAAHLDVVRSHARLTLLRRADVIEFGVGHAKVSDYATCLMVDAKQLEAKIIASGAEPVVSLVRENSLPGVYKRADILRVLELADDPLVYDEPRGMRFWKAFEREADRTCPSLIVPSRMPPHEFFLCDRKNIVRVVFNRRHGSDEISCLITAVNAQEARAFIKLDADDYDIASQKLVATICRSLDRGLENFKAVRQRYLNGVAERKRSAKHGGS